MKKTYLIPQGLLLEIAESLSCTRNAEPFEGQPAASLFCESIDGRRSDSPEIWNAAFTFGPAPPPLQLSNPATGAVKTIHQWPLADWSLLEIFEQVALPDARSE